MPSFNVLVPVLIPVRGVSAASLEDALASARETATGVIEKATRDYVIPPAYADYGWRATDADTRTDLKPAGESIPPNHGVSPAVVATFGGPGGE